VLEEVARMALHTLALDPPKAFIARHLLDKHFFRKHGENAYYGQQKRPVTTPGVPGG
jgi:L-ribulose-5-phosphate 4-epimerase